MKSISEKRLGPQYVVETENQSSFTNQIDSRLLSEKVWFFFNFPHFFLQSMIKKLKSDQAADVNKVWSYYFFMNWYKRWAE